MARLNMVILDNDKFFMNSVADFLQKKHISVSCFSCPDKFVDWLDDYHDYFDVLLVAQEWAQRDYGGKVKMVILLARDGDVDTDLPAVLKFQPGDRLADNIFRLVYGRAKNKIESKTRLVGVCSAGGGAGKTILTAAVCKAASSQGLRVFYLGLEDIPAGGLLYPARGKRNFSYILYAIKNNASDLNYRIEQTRCIDEETKINYLCPPDSALELYEFTKDELHLLLEELHLSGYDLVVVDLPAGLGERVLTVSEACHKLMYLIDDSPMGWHKHDSFMKELNLAHPAGLLKKKMFAVINRYKSHKGELDITPVYRMPPVSEPFAWNGSNYMFQPGSEMLKVATQIVAFLARELVI